MIYDDNNPFMDLVPDGGQSIMATTAAPTATVPYNTGVVPTSAGGSPVPAPANSAYPTAAELANMAKAKGFGALIYRAMLQKKYGGNWNKTAPATPPPTTPAPAPTAPTNPAPTTPTTPTTPATPATPAPPPPTMADLLRKTPGYQWRLDEGLRAINANAYANGQGNSGATLKALQEYGDNLAQAQYQQTLANYMGIAEQGRGAAGAVAGAGDNMGSGVAGAMNNAAQAYQNNANAIAGGAIARGNANASMWQGIAGGVGKIAGSFF